MSPPPPWPQALMPLRRGSPALCAHGSIPVPCWRLWSRAGSRAQTAHPSPSSCRRRRGWSTALAGWPRAGCPQCWKPKPHSVPRTAAPSGPSPEGTRGQGSRGQLTGGRSSPLRSAQPRAGSAPRSGSLACWTGRTEPHTSSHCSWEPGKGCWQSGPLSAPLLP